MDKALNDFTGLIRRAVDDYGMIQDGDRVAVGVSGGKDSLVLLLALDRLRRYYPRQFELEAVTIELGFDGMDFSPVAELCARINVPYTCVKTDIKQIVCGRRTTPARSARKCAAARSAIFCASAG